MSFQARRELLGRVALRYREADRVQKTVILDEFVASTGYARKYAIRLLTQPSPPLVAPIRRPRARTYGADVQQALLVAWSAANCICAKRLVPFLPELVEALERHGHLSLTQATREQLLGISAATVDRLLQPVRRLNGPRGISTTKPGKLLKHQVPVRTFTDWSEERPGFMEADLVAHCGCGSEGSFLHTLVLTDIATGWTECLPLLHRSQDAVVQALSRARQLLPFPLLGLDTDNGGEFLNNQLVEYCQQEEITFTRGRAYKKNDQCFVEQKNGVVVRQLVGYDRFEGLPAYQQLTELYRAVRLYLNFFQPSMKLLIKKRDGAKISRKHDAARTPLQRLLAAGILDELGRERLEGFYQALDPVRLLQQLECLQDALWRHALVGAPPVALAAGADLPIGGTQRFRLPNGAPEGAMERCATTPAAATEAVTAEIGQRERRQYRRSGKPRAPRNWRTRKDPFEEVWEEVSAWLAAAPERTAKSLLQQLQAQYPRSYSDGQLRTLQRRVKEWRGRALLEFDQQWLNEELELGLVLPGPLRAVLTEASSHLAEPVLVG